MHSRQRFPNVMSGANLRPQGAALAILLLFLIFVHLFMTFTMQSAQAQVEQNAVPPTAREAAASPAFASRLARHVTAEAAGKSRAPAATRPRAPSPLDSWTYENGPINGTTDAWTINFGYVASNSFLVNTSQGAQVYGFDFGAWEYPGDKLKSVDWSITSSPNGGTVYGSGTASGANLSDQFVSTSQYGYDIDKISVSGLYVSLANGGYYLNLQNASVPSGDPVYWDENSGAGCESPGCPSQAYESSVGTIPSESFDITGSGGTSNGCFVEQQGGFQVLHDFTGGQDGQAPNGVTIDKAGNLYGTEFPNGGVPDTLFKLAQKDAGWVLSPLHTFAGGSDGTYSVGLAIGQDGGLYATSDGGIQNCGYNGGHYCGQVFSLRPSPTACRTALCSWTENVLYQFTGLNDAYLYSDYHYNYQNHLVFDPAGNLYGTSLEGGAQQQGAVYQLKPLNGGWTESILYSFTGGSDGQNPSEVLVGNDGNLYGIAADELFQLVPSASGWTEDVLYRFDYYVVPGFLVQDNSGNLYNIAEAQEGVGQSEVFMLSPSNGNWVFTVLFLSSGHTEDNFDNLTMDTAGNLYFTGIGCDGNECQPFGHIDKLLHGSWQHQTLFYFADQQFASTGALALDANGNLYGTTQYCGKYQGGTVWQLSP